MNFFEKTIKFLSSLKLAVFIILALAVISAVGTIYEAKYDAQYAQKVVYLSIYMKATLGLLCVSLISVMVDRWPWKRHHTGFVLAHVGIIIVLFGAYITEKFGIDGSMSFPIGEKNRFITIADQEVSVFSSYANTQPTRIHSSAVDFFKNPPTESRPYTISLGSDELKLKKYYHYALSKDEFVPAKTVRTGPALRLQLQNKFVNMTQWIYKAPGKEIESLSLGPAEVVLYGGVYNYTGGNIIAFTPVDGNKLKYDVYLDRTKSKVKSGLIAAGESFETGWMDITLRMLKYLPKAERKIDFSQVSKPTPFTRSAVLAEFAGETQWVGLNSVVKFFVEDKVFYFSYGNRRIDVGFDIELVDFRVGNYQGTNRAMTYESDVFVEELGKVNISMNEPMKHNGYTFYQASFEKDGTGAPVASILSVNRDPGRPIKYLGSFLIVLGSIVLFYFRRAKIFRLKKSAVSNGAD